MCLTVMLLCDYAPAHCVLYPSSVKQITSNIIEQLPLTSENKAYIETRICECVPFKIKHVLLCIRMQEITASLHVLV